MTSFEHIWTHYNISFYILTKFGPFGPYWQYVSREITVNPIHSVNISGISDFTWNQFLEPQKLISRKNVSARKILKFPHCAICYCTTFGMDAMILQHPEGSISSQGAKPRGMKFFPRDSCKTIASRSKVVQYFFYMGLLNI